MSDIVFWFRRALPFPRAGGTLKCSSSIISAEVYSFVKTSHSHLNALFG